MTKINFRQFKLSKVSNFNYIVPWTHWPLRVLECTQWLCPWVRRPNDKQHTQCLLVVQDSGTRRVSPCPSSPSQNINILYRSHLKLVLVLPKEPRGISCGGTGVYYCDGRRLFSALVNATNVNYARNN